MQTIRIDRQIACLFPDSQSEALTTPPIRLAVPGTSIGDHPTAGIRVALLRRDLWRDLDRGTGGRRIDKHAGPRRLQPADTFIKISEKVDA